MLQGKKCLLEQHIVKLKQKFPTLTHKQNDNIDTVIGVLPFSVNYNNKTVEDEYEIEILIPDIYPDEPPKVKETKGKIPKDFHKNKDDSYTLCLGVPIAVAKKFKENPTLLHFVEQQVVPFLFTYSYYKKHNELPYGDLPHGGEGILKYYQEAFNISEDLSVLGLLKILADDNYRGHHICPCGSGNNVRKCHGKILRDIKGYQNPEGFLYEYTNVLKHILDSKKEIPKSLVSNNYLKI